jgi:hypothetical protein
MRESGSRGRQMEGTRRTSKRWVRVIGKAVGEALGEVTAARRGAIISYASDLLYQRRRTCSDLCIKAEPEQTAHIQPMVFWIAWMFI